ncbi:hypothetical protein P3612_10990 [Vibrio parahaemolyticus]|nr:hypothetical protein [Vibrio parahaemolyticus]
MDSKQFMKNMADVDNRLQWQGNEIRKVPDVDIEALTDEYNKSGRSNNPNLRGEFIINEYSLRNGHGENFYKPERKAVVYAC